MTPTDTFLDTLADKVAERLLPALLAELRTAPGARPLYATAKHNPCGSRRAFLRGARDGCFGTFKQGRETAAHWSDVERWWTCQRPSEDRPGNVQPPTAPANDLQAELDEAARPRRRRGGRA